MLEIWQPPSVKGSSEILTETLVGRDYDSNFDDGIPLKKPSKY